MAANSPQWSLDQVESLKDKIAVVTGANSGLGFETAKALVAKGATVLIACRNSQKAEVAATALRGAGPGNVTVISLDLSDLESVEKTATLIGEEAPSLDLLINNAGIMGVPLSHTKQGVELQLGTNHVGHFALTARLFPLVAKAQAGRIVTVSSNLHKGAVLDLADTASSNSYSGQKAYGRSKLANLLFALELNRRLEAAGSSVISVGAHPGWSRSQLAANGPGASTSPLSKVFSTLATKLGQKTSTGALPTLYGALGEDIHGGDYLGPKYALELFGPPEKVKPSATASDPELAKALWQWTAELTGVEFP
jgi:short-subunit dehydrogenase